MAYAFDDDLFVTDEGVPMCFNVEKCRNAEELADYIKHAGGQVDNSNATGLYTITFHDGDDESCALEDVEVYSSEFITLCCGKNKLLNLKKYRCKSSKSVFDEEFNPMDILQQKTSWRDAQKFLITNQNEPRLSTPRMNNASSWRTSVTNGSSKSRSCNTNQNEPRLSTPRMNNASSSGTSVTNGSSKSKIVLTKALGPKCTTKYRCEFTQRERKEIVQYLMEKNAHEEIRGTAIWKRMSVKFPDHTWQSLKEHFFKKVMPLIGSSYALSPAEINRFRQAVKIRANNRKIVITNAYSLDDDNLILDYVARNGKNAKLGGNQFWKQMESEDVLPDRTWSSLRERYLKYLRNLSPTSKIIEPPHPVKRRSPEKNTKSYVISSDSDESQSSTDQAIKTSAQRESKKVNNEVMNLDPREGTSKNKRKLFTVTNTFDSPSSNIPNFSPVSENFKGPSMLDILKRKHAKEDEARQRKIRTFKKRQAVSEQRDHDDYSENEQQDEAIEPDEDDHSESHSDKPQSEDNLSGDEEQGEEEGINIQNEEQIEEVQSDGSDTDLERDENQDKGQPDIQSDTTVETELPNSFSSHANNVSNRSYDAEHRESDESDWSMDGLYSRGTYAKRSRSTKSVDTSQPVEEKVQSGSASGSPMPNRNPSNLQNISKNKIIGSPDVLQQDCTEEPFDFLGDMTNLHELSGSTNTHLPVCSPKRNIGVTLASPQTAHCNNSDENDKTVNESKSAVSDKAESERSIAPINANFASNMIFKPLCHSTQIVGKLGKEVGVQKGGWLKSVAHVATQTDPVEIISLPGDNQDENSPQLSPKKSSRKRPSISKPAIAAESCGSPSPPSPVSAAYKIRRTSPCRRTTRSAVRVRESDSDSPKFTPPSK